MRIKLDIAQELFVNVQEKVVNMIAQPQMLVFCMLDVSTTAYCSIQ